MACVAPGASSAMPKKREKEKGSGGSAASTPRAEDTPRAAAAADPPPTDGDEEVEEEVEDQTANKREGGDISKVTDYVEQKELDSVKASQAIASITAELKENREAELARERELAAVSIEQVRTPEPHPASASGASATRWCLQRASARAGHWRVAARSTALLTFAHAVPARRVRRPMSTLSRPRWSSKRTWQSGRCASTRATSSKL